MITTGFGKIAAIWENKKSRATMALLRRFLVYVRLVFLEQFKVD
jgi:hypothetical protein